MKKYFNQLNEEKKAYFNILSKDYPEWLEEYIDTEEMERINKISISCGIDYSSFYDIKYFYSNLDHSVGVALIIWNFTHDKKQTLAGLFHDIATPVFKHCIDFMNNDHRNQESTEKMTTEIIKNSKKIMSLLKRDGISLEEVSDYKIYPIADNDTPKLSADRFEYTFSSGLTFFRVFELDLIKEIYENIVVCTNEEKKEELVFKNKTICEKYIKIISKLWPEWVSDNDRTIMQFMADMCSSLNTINLLPTEKLYEYSEEEVINLFSSCEDSYLRQVWNNFILCDKTYRSKSKINDKYCVNVKSKIRYINPLVKIDDEIFRISEVSEYSKKIIEEYLDMHKVDYYTYFNFEFEPYKNKCKLKQKSNRK